MDPAIPEPDCRHDFAWLDRPVCVISPAGLPNLHYNVQCTLCGARDWAHGLAPNKPTLTLITTPTTERS